MSFLRALSTACLLSLALSLFASARAEPPAPAPKEAAKDEVCAAHGVKKSICARCNPKLASVFKSKGDWCGEHERPESQCVLCNPALAKKGVK